MRFNFSQFTAGKVPIKRYITFPISLRSFTHCVLNGCFYLHWSLVSQFPIDHFLQRELIGIVSNLRTEFPLSQDVASAGGFTVASVAKGLCRIKRHFFL